MTPCIGWGRLAGHHFEPRYSTVSKWPEGKSPSLKFEYGASDRHVERTVIALKDNYSTYRGDACRRCGIIVNRREGAA